MITGDHLEGEPIPGVPKDLQLVQRPHHNLISSDVSDRLLVIAAAFGSLEV